MANKKAKEKRRGPGRPKSEPISPALLRERALKGITRSAEARGEVNFQETEEGLMTMLSPQELKKQTKEELQDLRKMAEMLWDKFQIEKEILEAQGNYGVYVEDPTPAQIAAKEEWDANHAFLKPKRKNAKQTHNIYSLPEHKREAYGIVSEPIKTTIDLDETEEQAHNRVMEAGIEEMKLESRKMKGKRVKKRDTPKPQPKTFWV